MYYGFTVENNTEWNDGELILELNKTDIWMEEKFSHVGEKSITCYFRHGYLATQQSCFAFARVAVFEGPGFMYLSNNSGPLFFENEMKAIGFIANAAKERLSKFPNTVQEDLELLKDPNIGNSFDYFNAIVVRKDEKEVYQHYIRTDQLVQDLNQFLEKQDNSHSETLVQEWIETEIPKENPYLQEYFQHAILACFKPVQGITKEVESQ